MNLNTKISLIFALCGVLLGIVVVCYASTFYSSDFDILTDGTFTLGTDVYAYFPDEYNQCELYVYEGVYGTETQGASLGSTGWPCWDNSANYILMPSGIPVLDGQYSLKYNDSTIGDIFVFTFYVVNGQTFSGNEQMVFITSPASGTEITDTSTEIVGGWNNIDSDFWTYLKLSWQDEKISSFTNIQDINISTDYGTFSYPLTTWNFSDKNGNWDLDVLVQNQALCYWYPDMPLEEQCLFNPVDFTNYYLDFNVSGWTTPFTFETFEDWYAGNVDGYETPSAWAVKLMDFITPLFEKIGEFGDRIGDYFNINNAYERGFNFGGVFPIVSAYIDKVDDFSGGFPLVAIFKWGITIILGLIVIKIIFKLLRLIPFVG